MTQQLHNQIPLRTLIKSSGKLFTFFLLGTLLITSLQDLSISNLSQRAISLSTLFVGVFIINTFFLHYFDQKRKSSTERIWRKTFIIGFLCSLFYFIIHFLIFSWLEQRGYIHLKQKNTADLSGWRLGIFILYSTLVVYTFIFLIQNSVLSQIEKNRIQVELLHLKASNSEAVNQLLRQQIQPHFLFNALNILKSLIKREPKRAETYLMHLSDFLRLSISKNTSGISTIEEELKICNDYMEMQNIRFNEALKFQIEIDASDPICKKKLPFFSLQPLLENAIKHNELTIENPLFIKIEIDGNYIKVSNNLQEKPHAEASSGKGLSMLKERYRILQDTPPIIKKEGLIFSVSLKILNS